MRRADPQPLRRPDRSGSPTGDAVARLRSRDRPRISRGESEIEQRAFRATEQILEQVGFARLTVFGICERAEIGRGSFYFYFSGKEVVVATLLARLSDELTDAVTTSFGATTNLPPDVALDRGVRAAWANWTRHAAVFQTGSQHWSDVPEISEVWLDMIARITDRVQMLIERARAGGSEGGGRHDSGELASLLVWATERLMFVAGSDAESPTLTVDSVLHLWQRMILAG